MKFSCTKENLSRGLSVVSHITTKNINLPILNNVLVKIENKTLKLITTNLEIAISCAVRGKVDEDGEFTVPAKLFADYIALLPNERIDCDGYENFLDIKCKMAETKINGMPAVDFPLIPKIQKDSRYRVYAPDLKKAVESVIFAASLNESRPEISGICVNFNPEGIEGRVVFAATDSYRLAESKIQLHSDNQNNEKKSIIVPSRTFAEALRIISVAREGLEGEDVVEIIISEGQAQFSYKGIEIGSRLIEGTYPDYKHIIPEKYATSIIVNKEDLGKAAKISSLFTKSGLNDVKLNVLVASKELDVSSVNSQTGENNSKIEIESEGPQNEIVLNYKYLIDGINNIETEKMKMKIIDAASPCLLEPLESKSGMDYLYIVMPIRV